MLTKSQKGLLLIAWATLLATTALLVWFRGFLGRELELQARLAGNEVEAASVMGEGESPLVDFGDAESTIERLMANALIDNAVLTRTMGEVGGGAREIPIVPYRLAALASLENRPWNEGLADWRRVSIESAEGELGALYLDLRQGPLGAMNLAIAVCATGTAAVLVVLMIGLFAPGSASARGPARDHGILNLASGIYQLERFALTGEIAAGLLRESRQPVFRIRDYVSKLRDSLGEVAGASMALLETENQIGQFLQILDDGDITPLLSPDPGQTQPQDINQVLRDVLKLTAQSRGDVRITADYGDDLPPLAAPPQYLIQALAAVVLTFFGLMSGRGELACSVEAIRAIVRITFTTMNPGGEILMSPGAFEPFSAAQASGSGLHLTVCRQIIEELGGTVEVSASQGAGFTLTIELPSD